MPKKVTNLITYKDHAVDVLAQVSTYVRAGRPFVLITSVEIKGGSARDVGSLAVVSEKGDMTGYMSNGCIDQDILFHATECLRSGKAQLLRYGVGSPFHDLTLPCGGSLSVWIDPNPDKTTLMQAYTDLLARRPATLTFQPQQGVTSLDFPKLTVAYQPKVALSLAGRGAIFRATAKIGYTIGFDISAFSPDPADLEVVDPYCREAPTHLLSNKSAVPLNLDQNSGFLTLFHDHDWEPAFIAAALETPASFIGALGSRRTQAARLAQLSEMGVSEENLKRVRGPIGLVPSLRDANLIAISALAEVSEAFAYEQQVVLDV